VGCEYESVVNFRSHAKGVVGSMSHDETCENYDEFFSDFWSGARTSSKEVSSNDERTWNKPVSSNVVLMTSSEWESPI